LVSGHRISGKEIGSEVVQHHPNIADALCPAIDSEKGACGQKNSFEVQIVEKQAFWPLK